MNKEDEVKHSNMFKESDSSITKADKCIVDIKDYIKHSSIHSHGDSMTYDQFIKLLDSIESDCMHNIEYVAGTREKSVMWVLETIDASYKSLSDLLGYTHLFENEGEELSLRILRILARLSDMKLEVILSIK